MPIAMQVKINKNIFQKIKDFIGISFRFICPDEWSERIGLTSLQSERISAVLSHIRGRLLDIGAGNNRLVRMHKNGIGVDIYKWCDDLLIVKNSARLPFKDKEFDTVSLLACLNHIVNREEVINEAHRVLKDNGILLITMINPIVSFIGHKIWFGGEDRVRGRLEGEVDGFWTSQIVALCKQQGFTVVAHKRFLYGLNNLYIAKKYD